MSERRKRQGIMLARPYERRRLTVRKFGWSDSGTVLIQPKLDGERCLARTEYAEDVSLTTSTGLRFTHLNHIKSALYTWIFNKHSGLTLDGELYRHNTPFEWIHSVASQEITPHEEEESLEYHVFDIKIHGYTQTERLSLLEIIFDGVPANSPIKLVPTKEVANNYQLVEEEINLAVSQAYEGIIIRHQLGEYEEKRSSWVMKFKPRSFDQYPIVDVVEAVDKHGTPKGMVGAFVVEDEMGRFEVGAGAINHQGRVWVWNNSQEVLNKPLVVAYNSKTDKGIPRHAVALSIIGIPDNFLRPQ